MVGFDFLFNQVEDDACAGHRGRDAKLGEEGFICWAVDTGDGSLYAKALPGHLAHDEVIFILAGSCHNEIALSHA